MIVPPIHTEHFRANQRLVLDQWDGVMEREVRSETENHPLQTPSHSESIP